ncbi:MAG: KEOPS complex kinase/ATPase Bud32 [Candidatus Micrarchaeia archaeon]
MAMGMNLVNEGAEAKIYETLVFGKSILVKVRQPKAYRVKELDTSIRISRTRKEAHAMLLARSKGAKVPAVLAYGKYEIYMEKAEGILLRDILSSADKHVFEQAGRELGKLHNAGIAHGDFTPANILISSSKNSKITIIDFGLSTFTSSEEEQALDVLLMKRSIGKDQFSSFLAGYSSYAKSGVVLSKLAEIEKRGRYQSRTLSNA